MRSRRRITEIELCELFDHLGRNTTAAEPCGTATRSTPASNVYVTVWF
jgi:hypothetical protein